MLEPQPPSEEGMPIGGWLFGNIATITSISKLNQEIRDSHKVHRLANKNIRREDLLVWFDGELFQGRFEDGLFQGISLQEILDRFKNILTR